MGGGHGRQRLVDDCAAFLASDDARRPRARAVVFVGEPGIGTSTMLDLVHAEVLARGELGLIVVDDVDQIDESALLELLAPLRGDGAARVLIGGRSLPDALRESLDRSFDRRIVELPRLDEEAARSLLVELGLMPWSVHATRALDAGRGVPRDLVDAAFSEFEVGDGWPGQDPVMHSIGAIDAPLCAFYRDLLLGADQPPTGAPPDLSTPEGIGEASAEATRLLFASRFEPALQLAERVVLALAAADDPASRRVRLGASTVASGVRGLRGEPIGVLSLHSIAGIANREGDALSELVAWRVAFNCSLQRGDISIARSSVERGIRVADQAGSVGFAGWLRGMLAYLHLVSNEPAAAEAYLAEVLAIGRAHGLQYLVRSNGVSYARALMARGALDEANVAIQEALSMLLDSVPDGLRIDMQVTAARIRSASGDVAGALEVLGSVDECRDGAAGGGGQQFWLALEAVRIAAPVEHGIATAELVSWADALGAWEHDVFGGALNAARLEVDAWRALREGSPAAAARLAGRAEAAWVEAGCGEELEFTRRLTALDVGAPGRGPGLLHAAPAGGEPAAPGQDLRERTTAGSDDPEAFALLTRREREIARYVAGGMTNPEIASELHLSPRTVEHHVASILRKLELPSRRALVLGRV